MMELEIAYVPSTSSSLSCKTTLLILPVKIVSQVNANEYPSRGGVDTHVVRGVVKVFCACVSLDVVGVVVSPAELYVDPVFLGRGTVHDVTAKKQEYTVID